MQLLESLFAFGFIAKFAGCRADFAVTYAFIAS
jgi:hypothetical protein